MGFQVFNLFLPVKTLVPGAPLHRPPQWNAPEVANVDLGAEKRDGTYGTMWGPRWIAKLVQITPITMVYYNYSYWGL